MAAAKFRPLGLSLAKDGPPDQRSAIHQQVHDEESGNDHHLKPSSPPRGTGDAITRTTPQFSLSPPVAPPSQSPPTENTGEAEGSQVLLSDKDSPGKSLGALNYREEVKEQNFESSQIHNTLDLVKGLPASPNSTSSCKQHLQSEDASVSSLVDKSRRLRLLFGDRSQLLRPSHTQKRNIDDEMGDIYTSSDVHSGPNAETVDQKAIREVLKSDPYDSLAEDPELEDPFFAACARRQEREEEEAKKKSKKKSPKNISQACQHPYNVDSGVMERLKPFEGAQKTGIFCPILTVARFPYKFIDKDHSEAVADKFFNGGKFWDRNLNVYFIHPPSDITTKPILLMPVAQVEKLISDISRAFHCTLSIPPYAEESGLCISFYDDGTPQPRFLGTSTSRGHYQEMERQIPGPMVVDFGPPRRGKVEVDRSWEAFREKMMLAKEATKSKSRAKKHSRRNDRIKTHMEWFQQLKRTQRYLGLRGRIIDLPEPETGELAVDEQKAKHEEWLLATNQRLIPLDMDKPTCYDFEQQPIFICVDVEANEHVHEQVTEIGISTLDTLDLIGVAPGKGGVEWMKQIRSRHFRIIEYSHVVNSTWVHGCPDRFEYGNSEWVTLANAGEAIGSCFRAPYSEGFKINPKSTTCVDAQYLEVLGTPRSGDGEVEQKDVSEALTSATTAADEVAPLCSPPADSSKDALTAAAGHTETAPPKNGIVVVEEDSRQGCSPTIDEAHGRPIGKYPSLLPNFNFDSLVAARKQISQRVTDDPSLLDDQSLIPEYLQMKKPSGFGKTIAHPAPHNTDLFLKVAPSSPETAPGKVSGASTDVANLCPRQIILIGHDTKADLGYLRLLGFDPTAHCQTLVEVLDTASIYKALKRESLSPKLGNVLIDLGLTGWHLHNAGNDARYTMDAMIGIAIKARRVEDNGGRDPDHGTVNLHEDAKNKHEEMEKRIQREVEEVRIRVTEEYDTWASIPSLAPVTTTAIPASTTPTKTSEEEPGLSAYSGHSPPVSNFTEDRSAYGAPVPKESIFPSPVFPSDFVDGGEVPSHPGDQNKKVANCNQPQPQRRQQQKECRQSQKKWKTFEPGCMDKEAVEKELARPTDLDWDGDGLTTIYGVERVESDFERIARERMEKKAQEDLAEMAKYGQVVISGVDQADEDMESEGHAHHV